MLKHLKENSLYTLNYEEVYNKFFKTTNKEYKIIPYITPFYCFKKNKANVIKDFVVSDYGYKQVCRIEFYNKNTRSISRVFMNSRRNVLEEFINYFKEVVLETEEFDI